MPRNMDRSLGDGGMPLLGSLGLVFTAYGEGWVEATWQVSELAANPLGGVHGGVFGVIHDAAMNFAANSALESGDRATTLEVSYQIMRPATADDALSVRGEVTRVTRQVAYVQSTVSKLGDKNQPDEVVTRATATFLLRRKPAE